MTPVIVGIQNGGKFMEKLFDRILNWFMDTVDKYIDIVFTDSLGD